MKNDAESTGAANRLPWVGTAGSSGTHQNMREFAGWIVAAALLVGGGAYWLALRTGDTSPAQTLEAPTEPSATAELPAPAASTATPQQKKPAPVHPSAPVKVAAPANTEARRIARVPRPSLPAPAVKASTAPAPAPAPKAVSTASAPAATAKAVTAAQIAPSHAGVTAARPIATRPGAILPVTDTNGGKAKDFARPGAGSALGERLVQLAAFRDLGDAKLVWRRIERSYPAMKEFHPSLIQNRDATGQAFYQFEIGTASQADSEMLCQSMQQAKIGCTIVRLPGR